MSKPIVFMFSGQGSQYFHMGRGLYSGYPDFFRYLNELDKMVSQEFGRSVLDILYDSSKSKGDLFSHSLDSSLAILMVEFALCKVLQEKGINPDYVLGASLGELSAAVVAGAVDFLTMVDECLTQLKQYELHGMKGAMIGILSNVDLYDESVELNTLCELAAVNFDSHFVVTCRTEHVETIEDFLKGKGVLYQVLPVSIGYHSSLLDPAQTVFWKNLEDIDFKKPGVPFISCIHAKEISYLDMQFCWDAFRKPIRFQEAVQYLEKQQDFHYIDLGPSGTLANFVKYNLTKDSKSEVFSILTPFERDLQHLEHLLGIFANY